MFIVNIGLTGILHQLDGQQVSLLFHVLALFPTENIGHSSSLFEVFEMERTYIFILEIILKIQNTWTRIIV